jgi:hypothetical protein
MFARKNGKEVAGGWRTGELNNLYIMLFIYFCLYLLYYLRDLSLRANYTDWATAACRRISANFWEAAADQRQGVLLQPGGWAWS